MILGGLLIRRPLGPALRTIFERSPTEPPSPEWPSPAALPVPAAWPGGSMRRACSMLGTPSNSKWCIARGKNTWSGAIRASARMHTTVQVEKSVQLRQWKVLHQ